MTAVDSNRVITRSARAQPRIRASRDFGIIAAARRDVLAIAKDHSPAAMLKICQMAGLVQGVEPASSEQVQFAAAVEVLDRAHGRPRPALDVASQAPLLVDFAWAPEAPRRLLEAAGIGCDDSGE